MVVAAGLFLLMGILLAGMVASLAARDRGSTEAAQETGIQEVVPQTFLDRPVGGRPASTFTLTDQDGRPVSLEDFRGRFVVVAFMYTRCRTSCPLLTATMHNLQIALRERGITDVQMLSITVDPEYDTPAVLKAYAQRFDVAFSNWAWLTGSAQRVSEVAAQYKASITRRPDGTLQHTHLTVLIDRQGRERHRYWGVGYEEHLLQQIVHLTRQDSAAGAGLPTVPEAEEGGRNGHIDEPDTPQTHHSGGSPGPPVGAGRRPGGQFGPGGGALVRRAGSRRGTDHGG